MKAHRSSSPSAAVPAEERWPVFCDPGHVRGGWSGHAPIPSWRRPRYVGMIRSAGPPLGAAGRPEEMGPMSLSREEAQEMFDVVDTDHDGMITPEELTHLWERTGDPITPDGLAEIFGKADTDGDGLISFDEFVALLWPDAP